MRALFFLTLLTALAVAPASAQIDIDDLPTPETAPERPEADARPDDGDEPAAEGDAAPQEQEEAAVVDAEDIPPLPVITEIEGCQARLDELDVRYRKVDPVDGDNGCGFSPAYRVEAVGDVALGANGSTMRCETALALALWIRQGVIPATRGLSREARVAGGQGVRLTGIRHGPSYACRRRNNQPTGKLSHHAIGAAIDVTGFEFEGRAPIPVQPRAGRGTIEEAFQRAVRASACLSFSTVLGPGSDEYHDDHLHLDIASRSSRYRLCQ
ncbi:extensin family protein [Roseitalea porphyridii]|uniref:Extensin family protein n=1 Tax=Roseitalea porphyridii TaxID=1852022 RepID=A0A4P6V447_9HYPH|nr:extensin family protein [Roseitalea porphyridii]QBK31290.1 extensin family protein [Roseitalea porphyridii]